MNIKHEVRERVQSEIEDHILKARDTIVHVSIRLGKTRAALRAIEEQDKVLIVYPLTDIFTSWVNELEEFAPKSFDITYSTTRSLKKLAGTYWNYVIVDEPQLLSPAQIEVLKTIRYRKRVGLTGTLNADSIKTFKAMNWHIGYTYSLQDAINDGIVKNYKIYIHFIELDKIRKYPYTRYGREILGTEEQIYKSYSETMDYFKDKQLEAEANGDKVGIAKSIGGYNKYMGLRTNLLYNSDTLLKFTNNMVDKFKDEKLLIYSLRTGIADMLCGTSYHSKNKDSENLDNFKHAPYGHLAVVNCIQAGVTIHHLNKVLFHSYESNTEVVQQKLGRSLLYEFDGEVSEVHFACLAGTQMETWVDSACRSLDQTKITYVFGKTTVSKLDYIRMTHPDKELYLYEGAIVYFSKVERTDFGEARMYKFLKSDKEYPLPHKKLIKL